MEKYKRYLAITLAICILGPAFLFAKNLKIGFIDSAKIFEKFKGTSDAQKKFDKLQEDWKNRVKDQEKNLLELKEKLETQSLLLSEEKKKELQRTYQEKAIEYQKFAASIWGQDGKAFRKNAELTKPIMEKINIILKKIGEDEGYSYIFDAAQGGMVFAEPGHDLTDRIVEELNRESQ